MSPSGQQHIYDYFIDEHGNWLCEGNPVTDPELFRLLSRSLFQRGERYFLHCEGETHPVRVADAPLWVRYVHLRKDSRENLVGVEIELQDGRREPLAADTLATSSNEGLYCQATHRRLKTRFGKSAYYELTQYLQADNEAGSFYFIIAGDRHDIKFEP